MIRELVSDGLFVLGASSSGKDNSTGFTAWDLPLDAAMAKIEDAYVPGYRTRYRTWSSVAVRYRTTHDSPAAVSAARPSPAPSTSVSCHPWSTVSVSFETGVKKQPL
jgi:hypothetical protein